MKAPQNYLDVFRDRTVKQIQNDCVNQMVIHFTDGSVLTLFTEYAGHGIYAIGVDANSIGTAKA